MTLRKQFEEETGNQGIFNCANGEWIQPYVNWLVARDKEHLAKIEEADEANIELEKSNKTLYQQKIKLMSELATLKQSIEDAPKVPMTKIGHGIANRYPDDDAKSKIMVALLELKDGE